MQILKDIKNIDQENSYPKKGCLAIIISHTKNGWLKIRMIESNEIFKIRNIPENVESYDRICAINNPKYIEDISINTNDKNEIIETENPILESNNENIIRDESYNLLIKENISLKKEIKQLKLKLEKISNIIQKYN